MILHIHVVLVWKLYDAHAQRWEKCIGPKEYGNVEPLDERREERLYDEHHYNVDEPLIDMGVNMTRTLLKRNSRTMIMTTPSMLLGRGSLLHTLLQNPFRLKVYCVSCKKWFETQGVLIAFETPVSTMMYCAMHAHGRRHQEGIQERWRK